MAFEFNSLDRYSAVLDVRSPAEYEQDHVPGAVNLPVLDDAQRHQVGVLHNRDAFAARKLGMGFVAANLAKMVAGPLQDKDRNWRPLVYCWRGGMRSSSVVEVMRKVGWRAEAIPGGYKSYRRHVMATLGTLPTGFRWVVLCGPTGSGKTLLLDELGKLGAQCLDLEGLANHRGSLFGSMGKQASQRAFESLVAAALMQMDAGKPVFVESESRKVGDLRVPDQVCACMHTGAVVRLRADIAARAALTARDYAHFADSDRFGELAAKLAPRVGGHMVRRWERLFAKGEMVALSRLMLESHYDPSYRRSLGRHYSDNQVLAEIDVDPTKAASLRQAAETMLGLC